MRDFIGFELGVAAGDDQDGIRVLPTDTMNHLPVFMIGGVGDRAGVNDAYIRLFAFECTGVSTRNKRLAQGT